MIVTLLGTGSPVPLVDRAGTSILISSGDDRVLIDCGPGTVRRLLERGVNPGSIDTLLFTHHHIDHNADFFQFVITNWTRGNGILDIYGPEPWTTALVDSIYDVYDEDLRYRNDVNDPGDLIWHLDPDPVTTDFELATDAFEIRALEVDHSIETYGFKLTDRSSGRTVVFSGDTRDVPALRSFARGAEVLIMDCCLGPVGDAPPAASDEYVWESYTRPLSPEKREKLHQTHCDPGEAGAIAADAGVGHLALTHLLPYRDAPRLRKLAGSAFDGDIHVAEDGLTFELTPDVRVARPDEGELDRQR